MSSGSGLPPSQHASFAVISRLISCLVTEQLLRGIYLPIANAPHSTGVLVVLSTHLISEKPIISRSLRPNDIFAIVPLRHPPVFAPVIGQTSEYKHGRPVGLVDPLDMRPDIFELSETLADSPERDDFQNAILSSFVPPPWELGRFTTLKEVTDPVQLWKKFVDGVVIQDALRLAIEKEIQSSYEYQLVAYRNPPQCPSLTSAPIEWEQSLVAGHPTHPMHRARMLPLSVSNYDWYHPRIRFVRVQRANIKLLGPFEKEITKLAITAAERSGQLFRDDPSSIVMPVHELQIPNVVAKFPDVKVLHPDINVQALAQSSIRTVVIPELPGVALKLAVGVKISSSLRTISHFTADFGPRFSTDIVPKLVIDPRILSISCEPASAVYNTADPDLAKHFTAIIREEAEPQEGEALIVSAALLEMDHAGLSDGVSAVERIFKLDTYEKRATFLDRYIKLACEALLPPLIHNGVAFEAHAQNVLARFDITTGEPTGFIIRDLGGLRIHPETLRESTGVDFQFLPGHCVVTASLEETYPKFYHTFVHNHVQRLIRILGMHSGQHPEWDAEIRFPVMKSSQDKFRKLEVACFAKESRSDDILGRGTVDITETLKTGEFDEWVSLNVDGVVRGDLYLEMTFFSNAALPTTSLAPPSSTLSRHPSKLAPSERLSRPLHAPAPSAVLHNLLSDDTRKDQGQRSQVHGADSLYLAPSPPSSRSSSVTSIRRVDSPLPPLPEGEARAETAPLPSTLLPGGGRPRPPRNPTPYASPPAPQLPSTLRPGPGKRVASHSITPPPHAAHARHSSASPPRGQYFATPSSPTYRPIAMDSYAQYPGPVPSTSPAPNPTHYIPPPAVTPQLWVSEGTAAGPLSFPIPTVAPVQDGTSTSYQSYAASSYTTPKPSHQPAVASDLPDPYLQARYQTPLPLPPGSTSPPRGRQGLMTPRENPDQARIEALRQIEDEAARRKEQEEKDLALAMQLDRELNL
ncbi:hypothetical protein D9615_009541 [Tricholomella constricta]|uniref:Uncharacterized protein n=1 Tax=Tricholomella constricta TaxID=117010 RepID=A0A8H5GW08_9AGAR|nr:hypothetical protein D9615_009541 [Tricholomella constricta]